MVSGVYCLLTKLSTFRIKPNPPVSKKGDYIVMRAEMDLVICLSACPQDITSICGNKPRNARFEIF